MELWLVGGRILTMNQKEEDFPNGYVRVVDGKIAEVGAVAPPKLPGGARVLDCAGCLVMPGLVNGHTHVGMSLLRGCADDLPLMEWLKTRIFPMEKKHISPGWVRLGSQLAALEMIRGGTTTFNDMYHLADETARVVSESGMNALCGIDLGLDTVPGEIERRFAAYFEKVSALPGAIPVMAPHSLYTCDEAVLRESLRVAKKYGVRIHTHVSETMEEVELSRRAYGCSPVAYFEKLGYWEHPTIAAHSVCLDDDDVRTMGRYRVGISHNIESNLKLGTKICRVGDLRAAGVRVALGTDSCASNNDLDLFSEADTAAKLQAYAKGAGSLTAKDTVKLLTIEGAAALRLDGETGSLEVGKRADIIAVDVDSAPHVLPLYNPYSHLVYSIAASDVRHTVSRGKTLMENRRVLTLDEGKILHEVKSFVP